MDLEESIDVDAPRSDVVAVLGDLASYAEWLDIVAMARPVAGTVDDPGGGPAWEVELRARIGPFARTKRLRMVRSVMVDNADGSDITFTRCEEGSRQYSDWTLSVRVEDLAPGGSRAVLNLHYGGSLWTPGPLERVLADQISVGRERLRAVVGTHRR
ncbi:MAG: SRPBCC family protein [Ilumatobacter sp.]|jgi:hypothetical protein